MAQAVGIHFHTHTFPGGLDAAADQILADCLVIFRGFGDNPGILVESANQLRTGTPSSKAASSADCSASII